MRWMVGTSLLLLGCSSCHTKESTTTGRATPIASADAATSSARAPVPAPVAVFEDAGERATLDLGHGLTLDIHPAGPALIVVDLKEPTPKPKWKKVFIERRLIGGTGPTQAEDIQNFGLERSSTRHSAEPGQRFTYRAKLDETGPWKEANIRLAEPKTPPPPPKNVVATPETPWSINLSWEVDVRAVAGIEVDVQDGKDWKLLAIVNPDESKFSHGYRVPKQSSRYRVATFNRNGKSAFVETATVTTPEKASKPRPPKPLPRCTKLPPPSDVSTGLGDARVQEEPELWSFAGGPGGAAPRRLFGRYQGCLREMGTFDLQGDTLTTVRPDTEPTEGFPVLVGIMGAGYYAGAQLGTYAFENGRYEEVDVELFCGETDGLEVDPKRMYFPKLDGEVTQRRGPFDGCLNEKPKR